MALRLSVVVPAEEEHFGAGAGSRGRRLALAVCGRAEGPASSGLCSGRGTEPVPCFGRSTDRRSVSRE